MMLITRLLYLGEKVKKSLFKSLNLTKYLPESKNHLRYLISKLYYMLKLNRQRRFDPVILRLVGGRYLS